MFVYVYEDAITGSMTVYKTWGAFMKAADKNRWQLRNVDPAKGHQSFEVLAWSLEKKPRLERVGLVLYAPLIEDKI